MLVLLVYHAFDEFFLLDSGIFPFREVVIQGRCARVGLEFIFFSG